MILSNNKFNSKSQDVLVCAITSKHFSDEYSVEITNDTLEYGVIPEPSVIKPYKLFTISKNKILKKFSIINKPNFDEVISKLNQVLDNF